MTAPELDEREHLPGYRPISGGDGYYYVPANPDGSGGCVYHFAKRGETWERETVLDWSPIVLDTISPRSATGAVTERSIRIQVRGELATFPYSEVQTGACWGTFPGATGAGFPRSRYVLANLVADQGAQTADGPAVLSILAPPHFEAGALIMPSPETVEAAQFDALSGYGKVAAEAGPEHWREACDIAAGSPNGRLALILGAALGGLYLAELGLGYLLDPLGFVVHAVGEGRQGKTTGQRGVAAVLGDGSNSPAGLVWSWQGTRLGINEITAAAHILPVVLSDTSTWGKTRRELGETVMGVLEGARPVSGRTGGVHSRGSAYGSILVSSGNQDLTSTLPGSPIMARIVEIPAPLTRSARSAEAFKRAVMAGHGWPLAQVLDGRVSVADVRMRFDEARAELDGRLDPIVADVATRCAVLVAGAWTLGELVGLGEGMRWAAHTAAVEVLDSLAAALTDSHRPLAWQLLAAVWEAYERRPWAFPDPLARDPERGEREGYSLDTTDDAPAVGRRLAVYPTPLRRIAAEAGIDDELPPLRDLRASGYLDARAGHLTGQFKRSGRHVQGVYIFREPPRSPDPDDDGAPLRLAPAHDDGAARPISSPNGAGNPAGWLSALSPADADRYAPSDDDDAERDAEGRLLARIASLPLADVARGVLLVGRELDEATRELAEATEALALYRGLTASDHWHMASAMAGLEHRGAESEAAPAPVVDEAAAMVRDAFELDADPRPRAAALGELVTRSPSPSLPDGPEPPATGASGAVGADGPRAPATPATVAVASPDALPAPSPRRARSERHSEARGALTWRSWQYAPRRRCAVDLVAHTWRADDGTAGRIAGRHKVATLGETLAAIGAAVGDQAATVYLVGGRPGGDDPRAVRAWFRSPVPERWAHDAKQGHYLVDLDRPVGHYRSPGGGRIAVHRFAAWSGDDLASCSPAVALDALATIDRALRSAAGRGVRWAEASALATPPTTGLELVRAAVPFDKVTHRSRVYPPIDAELRDLIRHTSGQGRVELCAAPGATLPGLIALDGRFMYAALTGGLPIGPAALVGPRDFDPRLPARWHLRATVPADWQHVGILPAERETPDVPERWPAVPGETFTTWADSAEAKVAHDRGWPLVVLGAIVFAVPGDPLGNASGRKRDGWAGHLVAARELVGRWRSSGELDADLAAIASAGLRSVLLFALGAMVGRARMVSHVGTAEQVPTGAAPEPLGGGLFTWETDEPVTAERGDLDRPEWSAHIYGRTRARLLVGSPGQPGGALSVPRANVVGFVMDALYLTADPHWHDDGASPGWFRAKGTSAGPVTVPATAAELHTLAGGEP